VGCPINGSAPEIAQIAKAKVPDYPFVPRSNAHLVAGQFFSFRLANGRYACGRVLATRWPHGPGSRRLCLVGLMDWAGDCPATPDDLVGRRVLDQGWAHIAILADFGATIDGHRPLETEGIVPDLTEEGVYGREVLRILAHKHFGEARPPAVRRASGGGKGVRNPLPLLRREKGS
jgi:hypothetical protein